VQTAKTATQIFVVLADGLYQQGAFDRAFKAFEDLHNTLGNSNELVTAKYLGLLTDSNPDKAF